MDASKGLLEAFLGRRLGLVRRRRQTWPSERSPANGASTPNRRVTRAYLAPFSTAARRSAAAVSSVWKRMSVLRFARYAAMASLGGLEPGE